jgi:hypothetical protein
MRKLKLAGIGLALAIAAGPGLARAQSAEPVDNAVTARVTPGRRYGAGFIHRFLLGDHYRDLWTTPLDVEVLDLAREAGGLTATGKGGGQQTRSLRLRGADGREFAFRSVDKDPSVLLPPELKGTLAQRILQDQISSAHPAGALVVPVLLDAAGIPHATPRLVLMPDDSRLGEFQAEFGGLLGIFEERATGDPDNMIVPGAVKVISSDKLFDRVEESQADRVNARALLAARLMDVFLGDWDRHRDQWRWVTYDEHAPRLWSPVPRDRDQAFVRFDGLLLSLARTSAPQLVNFGPRYPAIVGMTWNGRELDRRFLVELERPVWDSTARALVTALSDAVIEAAVARLPREFAARDSARLASALKVRRDRLPEAAGRFYRLLADEVDVHATDERERVVIEPVDQHTLDLTITRQGADGPFYHRRFHAAETGEVRVFAHGGADEVVARGPGTAGIRVRVVGGGGADRFADSLGSGGVRLYDTDSTSRVSGDASIDTRPYVLPPKKTPTELPPRDWGSRKVPMIWFTSAPDVGTLVGWGYHFTDYGFRQLPYASDHTVRAGFATGPETGKIEYHGDFRGENTGTHFTVGALVSGIETLRYYGLGNNSIDSGSSRFHRVRMMDVRLDPSVAVPLGGGVELSFGPTVDFSSTVAGNRFIDNVRPYGYGQFGRVAGRADLTYDSRDLPAYPTRGLYLQAGGSITPPVWDATTTYGELHGTASTYLSAAMPLQPVLALRAGARNAVGRYPFQEASYLGSETTVRLGRSNRYAGDLAVWGNAEVRLSLGQYYIALPGEWGLIGFGDAGRVYVNGRSPSGWHGAYGGGMWFAFLNRASTVSVSYAQSADRGRLYIKAGTAF